MGKQYKCIASFIRKRQSCGSMEECFLISNNTMIRIANPDDNNIPSIPSGAKISAIVEFVSNKAVKLISYEILPEEDKLELFKKIEEAIEDIQNDELKKLVKKIINNEEIKNALLVQPATTMSAYSYKGGLLSHIVRLINLIKVIVPVFNTEKPEKELLNQDLLLTAAIIHDIGKIYTIQDSNGFVEKRFEGEFLEDTYVTLKIVNKAMEGTKLTDEQKIIIEHIIGSSKGQLNFGALCLPRTKEAVAFHYIENLDIQVAHFEHLQLQNEKEDFTTLFKKRVYIGKDFF